MYTIRKTILLWFINTAELATDSIAAVYITVQKVVIFWEKDSRTSRTHPSLLCMCDFQQLSYFVYIHVGIWIHGCMLRYQGAASRWSASLPSYCFRVRGPCCCPWCQSSGYSTAVLGPYSLNKAQKYNTKGILLAADWQRGVLEVLFSSEKQLKVQL